MKEGEGIASRSWACGVPQMTRVVPRRHLLNSVLLAAALLNLIPLTNSAEAVSPRRGWGRGGKRTPLAYSVCVTGAAGFLGSEIVHQLLASGHQVQRLASQALTSPALCLRGGC